MALSRRAFPGRTGAHAPFVLLRTNNVTHGHPKFAGIYARYFRARSPRPIIGAAKVVLGMTSNGCAVVWILILSSDPRKLPCREMRSIQA